MNSMKLIGTRKTLSFKALTPIIGSTLATFTIKVISPKKVWIGSFIISFSLLIIVRQNTYKKD